MMDTAFAVAAAETLYSRDKNAGAKAAQPLSNISCILNSGKSVSITKFKFNLLENLKQYSIKHP